MKFRNYLLSAAAVILGVEYLLQRIQARTRRHHNMAHYDGVTIHLGVQAEDALPRLFLKLMESRGVGFMR